MFGNWFKLMLKSSGTFVCKHFFLNNMQLLIKYLILIKQFNNLNVTLEKKEHFKILHLCRSHFATLISDFELLLNLNSYENVLNSKLTYTY